ncbi:hypothetical protein BGZ96_008201 [Linnemannia gamsii]|uniref:Ubiquitin-like protease family profile domain-containing protein n=1 Tax=Linnemannia gamsii TaxID=64522 RepID=A0ABQ7JZU0_9FUNG|nr:hypothetical protein BGZ96_008201 [Linnemannia gamsii]
MTAKKQSKGVPIQVPTNQRRLSNFSVMKSNRALVTGHRDGGSTSSRRKSSVSSQGHQSPPFVAHKDDYDIIGTVPGFEAESNRLAKGKLRLGVEETLPETIEENEDHTPIKRKLSQTKRDHSISDASSPTISGPFPKRRKSSFSLDSLSRLGGLTKITPPSPPSTASHTPESVQSPSDYLAKHGVGSLRSTSGNWPQIAVTSVRVGPKTEFLTSGISVQFGFDRLALTIKRNCTRIPHTDLKLVEYYTGSAVKVIQLVTHRKLPDTSILAQYYDPAMHSGKARKITLYTEASSSLILDNCAYLKQKGVETKPLSMDAAEKILNANNYRMSPARAPEQSEETLFVFPYSTPPKTKSIAVRAEDVLRLGDGEFLNDTIIEFGLKYALTNMELKNKALAEQVYIFNTFFYQRLLAKPAKGATSSYNSIKSWTAKVDIFSKKYIIVPIHENLHWYLIVIVNPGLLLQMAETIEQSKVTVAPMKSDSGLLPQSADSSGCDDVPSPGSDAKTPPSGDDVDVDVESSQSPKSGRGAAEEKPYILCLDSLGGTHPTVFKVLRSYLQQELLARKGLDMALTTKEIAGKYSSKCPKQENLWDCGVYLLHYAEVLMRNPSGLLDSIQSKSDDKTTWATSELPTKREKFKEITVTLKQGYKAYQISQEFIEDFKEKSKEKSTTDQLRRSSGGSPALQEADSKELGQTKEPPVSSSGESSESGGEGSNNRRLCKDCGDRRGRSDASLAQKPDQKLRKMDTEL